MPSRRLLSTLLLVGSIAPAGIRAALADDRQFDETARPVLQTFCLGCHGPEKPKGGLDLSGPIRSASTHPDLKVWTKVLDAIEAGDMPPADRPQPDAAEAEALSQWLQATVTSGRCTTPPDPGLVTMRRLNRDEYARTIRDLLGVPFRASEDFPADDLGHGFDTNGDVLSLSPILMERYLSAAEDVTRATLARDLAPPSDRHREAEALEGDGSHQWDAHLLATNGTIKVPFDAPEAGTYRIRVRASAQQAGPDPARIGIRVDGREVATLDVPALPSHPEIYEAAADLDAGRREIGIAFLNDWYKGDEPDPSRRDRNLLVDYVEIVGHEPPRDIHPQTLLARVPANRDDWAETARFNLDRLASRAYRRPATSDEVARLVRLVEDAGLEGDPFENALALAAEAVLISPNFLYRAEIRPKPGDAPQPLDPYALASRLSYFLWGSMPDQELFDLAQRGVLADPATLEAQARRMLADPKSTALADGFADQWLQVRRLATIRPHPWKFPKFNDRLRRDMLTETEQFFEAIVREDRGILDFLDADFTFLNGRLARHYGIDGIKGDEFRRVTLNDRRRGGILTQASVLTVTSNPTRTSPVKRGKWVLEQVLGAPPPPPPPEAGELKDESQTGWTSLRKRMEAHRSRAECASCHQKMDPLGFGLENYDAIGAWREKDGDYPIDSSGTLPNGQTFSGPEQLKTLLAARSEEFARCLTTKMMTYALGRGLGFDDRCHVDRIVEGLAHDGQRFSRLVVGIVTSDAFRLTGHTADEGQTPP